ncbi:MAG: hypothetical protein P1U50_13425 [Parvibaculaceae bacterium]|nr:hypothetical protein [Parvibaculaceae bacterium]
MKVSIKSFDVEMEVKNKGIELAVRSPDGKQLGDLVITKSKLVWCKGKTKTDNGIPISWDKFIKYMEDQ